MVEKFSHCVFLNVTQALPQEGLSPPSPRVRKVQEKTASRLGLVTVGRYRRDHHSSPSRDEVWILNAFLRVCFSQPWPHKMQSGAQSGSLRS